MADRVVTFVSTEGYGGLWRLQLAPAIPGREVEREAPRNQRTMVVGCHSLKKSDGGTVYGR
jgi:hypothetical protein